MMHFCYKNRFWIVMVIFHQYQQNKQSHLIVTEHAEHKNHDDTTYDVGNPIPGLGHAQKCDGV